MNTSRLYSVMKGGFTHTLALVLSCLFSLTPLAYSEEKTSTNAPHILLLNSYHQGFKWTDELVGTITRDLIKNFPDAELNVVYLDRKRQLSVNYLDLIRKQLQQWYPQKQPDVIITSDDAALSFVKQWSSQLFPNVPVVFCGVNDMSQLDDLPKNYCGIMEKLDIKENIELVQSILPDTSKMIIVTDGTPTGRGTRREIITYAREFTNLTFEYLNGEDLSTQELLQRLKRLKQGTVVIAPAWYLDKSGNQFSNRDIYPLITRSCPVPVIVTSSANLEFGALGGKVNSGQTQGKYAASLAIQIIKKTATPETLGVEVNSRNQYVFDTRQLQRFEIPESRLPKGSLLLFKTFSFYETYKTLVWTIVLSFAVFLSMIIALLLAVHRLRSAKADLKHSRENLHITLNSIGDAVISTDTQCRITNMNPVAERLTGWKLIDAKEMRLPEALILLDAESRQPWDCPALEVIRTGEPTMWARGTLISHNKFEYPISMSGAPIRNRNKDCTGAVFVFRDMSEEYALQERLKQSQKMDTIGQLAGGIAHDFNNTLGGIVGAAELAQLQLMDKEDPSDLLDIIIETSRRASALTKKLLTFARKQPENTTILDLRQPIQDALLLFKATADRKIHIHAELPPDELKIVGDASLLQNSFLNLLINASHAMPNGGELHITSRLTELDQSTCQTSPFELEPGSYVDIEIRDTGCGISPEHLSLIFDPFFSTKDTEKGTGLGLSAVFGAVKQHRGAITVYSKEKTGTSFHVTLPLTNKQMKTAEKIPLKQLHGSGTILIIDDEEMMRTTGRMILSNLGYTVLVAEDGVHGIEIFKEQQQQIDLVLLDMIMPKMSGVECFQLLRKLNPTIPIIISSGFSQEDELLELKEQGLNGFLHKPYQSSDLGKAIKVALAPLAE